MRELAPMMWPGGAPYGHEAIGHHPTKTACRVQNVAHYGTAYIQFDQSHSLYSIFSIPIFMTTAYMYIHAWDATGGYTSMNTLKKSLYIMVHVMSH